MAKLGGICTLLDQKHLVTNKTLQVQSGAESGELDRFAAYCCRRLGPAEEKIMNWIQIFSLNKIYVWRTYSLVVVRFGSFQLGSLPDFHLIRPRSRLKFISRDNNWIKKVTFTNDWSYFFVPTCDTFISSTWKDDEFSTNHVDLFLLTRNNQSSLTTIVQRNKPIIR